MTSIPTDRLENDRPTALILGATGLIGGILLRQVLASGLYKKVYAISRKRIPLADSHLEVILDDMSDIGKVIAQIEVTDVFCCLGTTMKKAGSEEQFRKVDFALPVAAGEAAKLKHVRHYLVVSAIGANRKSSLFYNKVKGELEYELQKLGFPFLTIMQPSLLLGDRDESRLLEKLSGTFFSCLKPVMIGGLANVAPINATDVAKRMLNEAKGVENKTRSAECITVKSGEMLKPNY